jgi:hypothetical protein
LRTLINTLRDVLRAVRIPRRQALQQRDIAFDHPRPAPDLHAPPFGAVDQEQHRLVVPARRGTPATPADLRAHDAVTFEGLMSSTAWALAGDERVPMRSRLKVRTADGAIAAALLGLGVTSVLF